MKNNPGEIDEGRDYIGFREACEIITASVRPAGEEELALNLCSGRISARDIAAQISYPSQDVSLKDGFAVKSCDVASAAEGTPVRLKVAGTAYAGGAYTGNTESRSAVKICSGSVIPAGADAVVSAEFCNELPDGGVLVKADAGPGRNIMRAGSETAAGEIIISRGERLTPGRLGLAAASGITTVQVCRKPRVGIISIGDEVVAPGEKLNAGQLYASNMVTMQAWLDSFGIPCITSVVPDDRPSIIREVQSHLPRIDLLLTSGGAWGSERDLVIGAMDNLCWKKLFHYVRMGPGKGVAFGLFEHVPVFCLPGGPTSNGMAFLQLALPAILRMAGDIVHPLRTVPARLAMDIKGRHHAWTEFMDAVVSLDSSGSYTTELYRQKSRLKAIAGAGGLICKPEGRESLNCGEIVQVQLF